MPRNILLLRNDLKDFIDTIVTEQMMNEFGLFMRDIIYKRVKSGKGLTENKVGVGDNSLKKLNELSEPYIKYRKKQKLGPLASPARSNLTFTGELLEAIVVKAIAKNVNVEIDDRGHSRFREGVRALALKVAKDGRPFFGLSDSEVKILDNFVNRKIRERIRSLNK